MSILAFMGVVAVLATVATMHAGWSFTDASIMVTLTTFALSSGAVRPIDTAFHHLATIGTIGHGRAGLILSTGTPVQGSTMPQ